MKKMKKSVACILAATIMGALVSCGKQEEDDGNIRLKWVMPGPGIQNDSQLVWDEFNKRLQEYMPGVTVDFEIFPTADYSQQFMLMQTAGTTSDIANAYLLDFAKEVRNQTFMPIDEYSDILAGAKEQIPEAVWDYMRVDGKLYGIPSYQMLCVEQAIVVPAELAGKYLDEEAFQAALWNKESKEPLWDEIEKFLEKCKEGGDLGYGFQWGTTVRGSGYTNNLNYTYAIKDGDPEKKVVNIYTTDEEVSYAKRKAEWYKKGYIRKDALSAADDQKGKEGGYVMWQETASSFTAEKQLSAKYGMPVKTYFATNEDTWNMPIQYAALGNCIMTNSKHPEEAVKLLNLINSAEGKELYNLLVFGIEGKHYTKDSETRITVDYQALPDSSSPYGLYKWIVGNTKNAYEIQSEPEGYNDWVFDVQNAKAVTRAPEFLGFSLDTSKISSKLAQISAVKAEYYPTLLVGATEDAEALFNEYKDKLNKAGEQEVIAEIQRQADEFLANKK